MARIDSFLKLGLAQGCSDIHLAVGVPPMLRMNGDLLPIKFRDLADTELESYIDEILTATQKKHFQSGKDLDFSYVAEEGARFRVNLFRKDTGPGATFRYIPSNIPTLDGLGADGDGAHAENEYVVIRSLKERTILAARRIEALCR